jgi:hypothetical protein
VRGNDLGRVFKAVQPAREAFATSAFAAENAAIVVVVVVVGGELGQGADGGALGQFGTEDGVARLVLADGLSAWEGERPGVFFEVEGVVEVFLGDEVRARARVGRRLAALAAVVGKATWGLVCSEGGMRERFNAVGSLFQF